MVTIVVGGGVVVETDVSTVVDDEVTVVGVDSTDSVVVGATTSSSPESPVHAIAPTANTATNTSAVIMLRIRVIP